MVIHLIFIDVLILVIIKYLVWKVIMPTYLCKGYYQQQSVGTQDMYTFGINGT